MANREKGETAITINGKDYTMYLGTHEMGLLEDKMSTPGRDLNFWEIHDMVLRRNKVGAMEAWTWAALQKFHAAEFVTLKDAADLIDAAGGILAFGKQLLALHTAVTPDPDDLKELGISRPRTAQGTRERKRRASRASGAASTPTLDASV